MSLEQLIRLWRNERGEDSRPNKALNGSWLAVLLAGYEHVETVLDIIQNGVCHVFDDAVFAPNEPPPNHKSADRSRIAFLRSIGKGQNDGTYLVLHLDTARKWQDLRYSPFGCVPKADMDPLLDARLIHNLSYPVGSSTNAASCRDALPPVRLRHVRVLARRIELLRRRYPGLVIMMMKGDVHGAFRHIPLAASIARWFAGSIANKNTAVVDLALPFGWTGSPALYGIFGGAITYLVSQESPSTMDSSSSDTESFFGYEWVDDHVLLEVDHGDRLSLCENALRLAMLATLGPRSINEAKFSSWSTKLQVLGLEWDTQVGTVSMPEAKIAKALLRIDCMATTGSTSKHQLSKLLGSLRHVCSCVRPAKAFYQRLVGLWRRLPEFATTKVPVDVAMDLHWFHHIMTVGRLRSIPTSFFDELPEPDVDLYMDASNTGLCVLNPAVREYLRVRFDLEEQGLIEQARSSQSPDSPVLSINVREQLSAVLALLVWGRSWAKQRTDRPVHVRCWVDNTSAVSWCNSLYSRNPLSQELNRVIAAMEAQFDIRVSAQHVPGARNFLADLGSRAWEGDQLVAWSNAMCSWREQIVPSDIRKIYNGRFSPFNVRPSHDPPVEPTSHHGTSGASTDRTSARLSGSHRTILNSNPYNWLRSPFTPHDTDRSPNKRHPLLPFDLKSATLAGIIACDSASAHTSLTATASPSPDYAELPRSSAAPPTHAPSYPRQPV